jgi:hypothetical protein
VTGFKGNCIAVGYGENFPLPNGRNIQNRLHGFKIWASDVLTPEAVNIVILIKGGMTQNQYNIAPVPGLGGLPAGTWPPATPQDMMSRREILNAIDETVAIWGAERQLAPAYEIAKSYIKAVESPGVFGAGGQDSSPSIANRGAVAAAVAAEDARIAAHAALVVAYEAGLAALGGARPAAVAAGAVAGLLAVDPPHPGNLGPAPPLPPLATTAIDGGPGEVIPDGLGGRLLADPLVRRAEHPWPLVMWSGMTDVLGRLGPEIAASASTSRAFTDMFREENVERLMMSVCLLSDSDIMCSQLALRNCQLTAARLYPDDRAPTHAALGPAMNLPAPLALAPSELEERTQKFVTPDPGARHFHFTQFALEYVRQKASRTGSLVGPMLAAQLGGDDTQLSGYGAQSPYGLCQPDDMCVWLYNEEVHCMRLANACFGTHGVHSAKLGIENTMLKSDSKPLSIGWSDAARERGTYMLRPVLRAFNTGYAEPILGQATMSAMLQRNQHGLMAQAEVLAARYQLVEFREGYEDDELPLVYLPRQYALVATKMGRRVGGDYPWGRARTKKLLAVRVTNVQPNQFVHLDSDNCIVGSFVRGIDERGLARRLEARTNVHLATPFRQSNPFGVGPQRAMSPEDMVAKGLDSIV